MTKTLKVLTLNTASTKVEEIEAIEELANSIPAGTYLRDLFTGGLIKWVSSQIKNDFVPDIMDNYAIAKSDCDAKTAEILKLQAALENANAKYAKEIEISTRSAEIVRNNIETIRSMTADADRTSRETYEQKNELESTVATQAQTIIELKAKLFDLMTK